MMNIMFSVSPFVLYCTFVLIKQSFQIKNCKKLFATKQNIKVYMYALKIFRYFLPLPANIA